MAKVLELKNVSKVIGKKRIVDNISFDVNQGEVFGFLGPNGAGKTTTIKMITGLLNITEGEIFICGNNVKSDFENALSVVGGIIENPEMYGYLSGMDNLKIYSRMHGDVSKERINEIISLVKLENRINDKVKKYSLGMRQRLGLAQALLHSPKLLILDEPTNGLDPAGIKELRDTLRELCDKEGLAVLVSSHLLSEMELMCDRFGIIDNGKMIDIKTIKDIKNQGNKVNVYKIVVDNTVAAEKLLGPKYGAYIKDEYIMVETERHNVPEMNRVLVKNNIDVYEISVVANTLEEEFMKVTTGSKTQIR